MRQIGAADEMGCAGRELVFCGVGGRLGGVRGCHADLRGCRMRYRPADLARLGEGARRQIANFRFAQAAQVAAQGDQLADEKPKRSKYGAEPVTIDGRRFDSKLEAGRYLDLRRLHRAGVISELICQPVFPVEINGIRVFEYRADFQYTDENGRTVIEDAKGFKTPVYRLKKRIVEAVYQITITEFRA
jgi:hypothetical protein